MIRRRPSPARLLREAARHLRRRSVAPSPAAAPAPTPVRQALFELLEPRLLMSADPFQVASATVAAGSALVGHDLLLRAHQHDDGSDWLQVIDQGTQQLVAERLAADVSEVVILGSDGLDDHLTVDLTRPIGVDVTFHGGAGAVDAITVQGGSAQQGRVDYTAPQDGTITLDGQRIAFTGLEPTTLTTAVADLVLSASGASDVARLEDNGATPSDGFSRLTSVNGQFETTVFRNPTNSLTINLGDGDDSLTLDRLTTDTIGLRVDGQGGADRLDWTGSFRHVARDVTALAETITMQAGSSIDTRGGVGAVNGNVSFTAGAVANVDPTFLNVGSATPVATILVDRADIQAGNINLFAIASVTATVDIGGAGVATLLSSPTADLRVTGDSLLAASGNLTLAAITGQSLTTVARPEGSGNVLGDAAFAITTIDAQADLVVDGSSSLASGGNTLLSAGHSINVQTTADGASRTGGGVAAVTTASFDTRTLVAGAASMQAGGTLTIQAAHAGAIVTSATGSQGGMAAGASATDTNAERTLGSNADLAQTADGTVGVAAAVAVTTVDVTTLSRLVTSGTVSSAGAAVVGVRSDLDTSASADAARSSAANGAVAAAVAINDTSITATALLGGNGSYSMPTFTVRTEAPNASVIASTATSGANAGQVGIAGALAVTVAAVDHDARVEPNAAPTFKGTDVALSAASLVDVRTQAGAGFGVTGGLVGVGASVAVNVADVQSTAALRNASRLTGVDALSITAADSGTASAQATSGGEAGIALAPAVAVNLAQRHSDATTGTGAALELTGGLTVQATEAATSSATASGQAFGGNAALGGSVAIDALTASAEAVTARDLALQGALVISSGLITRSSADASASARGAEKAQGGSVDSQAAAMRGLGNQAAGARGATGSGGVAAPSASTGDGAVQVAAAVAVNTARATGLAAVGDGTSVKAGSVDVRMLGLDVASARASADAVDTSSKPALGAAVAINATTVDHRALVGTGAKVASGGDVNVQARLLPFGDFTRHDGSADARSGVGEANVGVAGALAVNASVRTVEAALRDGVVLGRPGLADLNVEAITEARDRSVTTAAVRGEIGAQRVGVGAGVAVNVADLRTSATVGDGGLFDNGGATALTASARHTLFTSATAGAAGGTSVVPAAAIAITHDDTLARWGTGEPAVVQGRVDLAASGDLTVDTRADGGAAGNVAVGAALALTVAEPSVRAQLAHGVTTPEAVSVTATGRSTSESLATASARGAASTGGPNVDTQVGAQRALGNQAAGAAGARTSGADAATPSARTGDGQVAVAAAVAVQIGRAEVDASVGPGAVVRSGADIALDSVALAVGRATADGSAFAGTNATGIGAAVALNVGGIDHGVHVGDGATLAAQGALTLQSRLAPSTGIFSHTFEAVAQAGGGGASAAVGIAGALAINVSRSAADVVTGTGATLQAGDGGLQMRADGRWRDLADAKPGTGASGRTAVGAAVAVNVAEHATRAGLGDGSTAATDADAAIEAFGSQSTQAQAAGTTRGGTAVTPVAAITVGTDTVTAFVGAGAVLKAGVDTSVLASNGGSVGATADGNANAASNGAGIGASVAVNVAQQQVRAQVLGDASAGKAIGVDARDYTSTRAGATASAAGGRSEGSSGRPADGVDREIAAQRALGDRTASDQGAAGSGSAATPSARSGDGSVAVAAAVAVNVARSVNAIEVGAGASVSGSQTTLQSRSTHTGDASADGSAALEGSGTGIGAAVAVQVAHVDQTITVGAAGSVRATDGLLMQIGENDGGHRHEALAIAGGGGAGADVGIAGALAINVSDTRAELGLGTDAVVDGGPGAVRHEVALNVSSTAEARPEPGAAGASGDLGVGAGVAVNVADAAARTLLLDGAAVSAGTTLDGVTTLDLDVITTARQGAKGDTGVAGAVAITVGTAAAETVLADGASLTAGGALSTQTTHETTVATTATGRSVATSTALGAAFALTSLHTSAATTGSAATLSAGGTLAMNSRGDTVQRTTSTASAAGERSDDAGSTADDDGVDRQAARQGALGQAVAGSTGTGSGAGASTPSARTSEGTVSVAAAIGIGLVEADVATTLTGGSVSAGPRASFEALGRASSATSASGAAVVEGPGTGVGAAVAIGVNRADHLATITGTTVQAGALALRAGPTSNADNVEQAHSFITAAQSGGGGSEAKVGVAGSVAINAATSTALAAVQAGSVLTLGSGSSSITAGNRLGSAAGALVEGTGGSSIGVGASFALELHDSRTTAEVGDAARWTSTGALNVDAASVQSALALANGGAEGGTAIAPSVAITVAHDDTTARIGSGPAMTVGALAVDADQASTATATATGSANAKNAGVGASLALAITQQSVLAATARNVTSTGSVGITAAGVDTSTSTARASVAGADAASSGGRNVDQQVAGQRAAADNAAAEVGTRNSGSATPSSARTSDGQVAVAAAVGITLDTQQVTAGVGDGTTLSAAGAVTVGSRARSDGSASAEGTAVLPGAGQAVGAAVAIQVGQLTNTAQVGAGATVRGPSLALTAQTADGKDTATQMRADAKSGAGGRSADVGVAGALAINVAGVTTEAVLRNGAQAQLATGAAAGDSVITATTQLESTASASPATGGGAGAAGETAVGASVALNIGTTTTTAGLQQDAGVTGGRDLSIAASQAHTMSTTAQGSSSGGTAVTPVVALSIANDDARALLAPGGTLDVGNNFTAAALHIGRVDTRAQGSTTATGAVGVGASVALAFVDSHADVLAERDLKAGRDLTLAATQWTRVDTDASASVAGGKAADGGTPADGVDRATGAQRLWGDQQASAQATEGTGGTGATPSASTEDGTVSVAAAVGLSIVDTDTQVELAAGRSLTSNGAARLEARGNTSSSTTADGSATASGSPGVGAAVAIDVADVDIGARLADGSRVSSGGLTVSAGMFVPVNDFDRHRFEAVARAGAGGGSVGVAGAVAINASSVSVQASAGSGVTLVQGNRDVRFDATSVSRDTARAEPTQAFAQTGAEDVGVGASLALNLATVDVGAVLATGVVFDAVRDATLAAGNVHDVSTQAQGGAAAQTAITPVVAISVQNDTTQARIDGTAGVTPALVAGRDLVLNATQRTSNGTSAEGSTTAEDVGVGASVAILVQNDTTAALLNRDARAGAAMTLAATSAAGGVASAKASVTGSEKASQADGSVTDRLGSQRGFADGKAAETGTAGSGGTATPNAETSSGGVVVGAAVALDIATSTTRTRIADGVSAAAGTDLALRSRADTDASAVADGSAVNGEASVGVGAAVAITVANVTNEAKVGANARLAGRSVVADAGMGVGDNRSAIHTFVTTATSGAGAKDVGVAGSVALTFATVRTEGAIERNATLTLAGGGSGIDSLVRGQQATSSSTRALAGGDGAAAGTGVGASFALDIGTHGTRAEVENGVRVLGTAGGFDATAAGEHTVNVEAENGAKGDNAVGAAVAIAVTPNTTLARLGTGVALNATGGVDVTADHRSSVTTRASGEAGGRNVGVGASVALAIAPDSTRAEIARNVTTTGAVSAVAAGSTHLDTTARAGANGAASLTGGGSSADSESAKQRDFANAKAGTTAANPSAKSTVDNANGTAGSQSGAGGSSVGVAAAIALNIGLTDVRGGITANRTIGAGGLLTLGATGDTDTRAQAIATSVANDTNVGAALGMNVTTVTHDARLGDASTVTAAGLRLNAGTTVEGINTVQAMALAGAGASQTGVSGSVGLNILTGTTTGAIGANAKLTLGALGADVRVAERSEVQNIVGAGAVGRNTSVGGSIGVNVITETVRASVGDGVSMTSVGNVSVSAAHTLRNVDDPKIPGDPSLLVVGGAAGGDAAIAGSVAVNVVTVDTRTTVGKGSALAAGDGTTAASLALRATDDTRLVTLAGALGGSLNSVGVGAGVDVTVLRDTTRTEVADGAALRSTATTSATAQSSLDLTSVAAALALSGSGVAVAGGIGVLALTRDTQATTGQGVTLAATGAAGVAASASDRIEQVAANAAGSGSSVAVAGAVAVTTLEATTRGALGAGNVVDAGGVIAGAIDAAQVGQTAGTAALGLGSAGIGASTTTFVHRNVVDAAIGSASEVTLSGRAPSSVTASSTEQVRAIAAGAGVGAGSVGVAGSATVNVLEETTRAHVEDGVKVLATGGAERPSTLNVTAQDTTTLLGLAGGIGGGSSVGVGAGADVGVLNKVTEAWIDGATVIDVDGHVIVDAGSRNDIRSISAAAGIGGSVGVMGSASIEVLNVTTRAWIGDDPSNATDPVAAAARVDADGSVVVNANDATKVSLLAGNIGGAGSVSVGAAGAVAVVTKTTQAFVAAGSVVDARGALDGPTVDGVGYGASFVAPSGAQGEVGLAPRGSSASRDANNDGVNDLGNGSFSGKRVTTANTEQLRGLAVTAFNSDSVEAVGVSGSAAGSVAVNVAGVVPVVNADTGAWIGAGAQVNQGSAAANKLQTVLVAASSDLHHLGVAGVASLAGTAAIGPGVDVSVLHGNTRAFVDAGARVRAADAVRVQADAAQDVLVVAAGLAVAGTAGIGGAVPVLTVGSTTEAFIGRGAVVRADRTVLVDAQDDTSIDVIGGAGGLGLAVGVGVTASIVDLQKDTSAFIADEAVVDGLALNGSPRGNDGVIVSARSGEQVFNLAAAMGVGLYAGVGGGVAVTMVDADTTAFIGRNAKVNADTSLDDASTQDVIVRASDNANIIGFAGGIGGGIAGIGGGIDIGVVRNDTQAFVAQGAEVRARDDVSVAANASRDVRSNAIAAGVGLVGVNAAVGVWTVGASYNPNYSNGSSSANALVGSDGRRADEDVSGQAGRASQPIIGTLGGYSSADRNGSAAAPDNTRLQGQAIADANTRFAAAAPGSGAVSARLTGAPGAVGTRAFVEAGALVQSGDAVAIAANETNQVDMLIGSGSIGLVGVGAGVAVLNVDANVSAFLQGRLDAGGNVVLAASLDNELSTLGIAGTVGFVGLGAAVTVASDQSDVAAYLDDGASIVAARDVSVSASADRSLTGTTFGLNAGAVAVGASFADLTIGGSTRAFVADADVGQAAGRTVNSLTLTARDDARATADTKAIAAGAIVVSANFADVEVKPAVEAALRAGAAVDVDAAVTLDAGSFTDANAQMLVPAVGVAAFSVGRATAEIAPTVDASVRTAAPVVAGGNVSVTARHNVEGVTLQTSRGADAKVNSPTGGGVSGNTNLPTATSRASVVAQTLAGTSVQAGGSVTVAARAYDRAAADSDRFSLAVAALGVSAPVATVSSVVRAGVAGNVTATGAVAVDVLGRGDARVDGDAPSAGLVSANGIVAIAGARPTATAEISGAGNVVNGGKGVTVSSGFSAIAEARGFTFNAGAAAIGAVLAQADATPTVTAQLGGTSRVTSAGGVALVAGDGGFGGTRALADAQVPGAGLAAAVNGGVAIANALPTMRAIAGADTTVDAAGTLRVDAASAVQATATARALSLSLGGALGTTVATANASGSMSASLPANVLRAGVISINTAASGSAIATGEAPAAGLVAGSGSAATATFSPTLAATLGHATVARTVPVTGGVTITAVANGTAAAQANGLSIGAGAIGVMVATATTGPSLAAQLIGPLTLNAGGELAMRTRFNEAAAAGASARADAPGGGLVSGNGALATANARAVLDTSIGAAATANVGSMTMSATSRNSANAQTRALSIGVGAIGTSLPRAEVTDTVRVHVDGTVTSVGKAALAPRYDGTAVAVADASGGGIVGVNGAIATASNRPTVEAWIGATGASRTYAAGGGGWALEAVANTAATSNVSGLSIGVLALGQLSATSTVAPSVLAEVRGTTRVNGGGLALSAAQGGSGAAATAESPATVGVLGAIVGANPSANAAGSVIARTNATTTVDSSGSVVLSATSQRPANAVADSLGIGAIGVGTARAVATSGGTNEATLAGTVLRSASVQVSGALTGSATSTATSASGGLVAGNGATATSTAQGTLLAQIAAGASVTATGEVRLSVTGGSIANATANGAVGGLLGLGHTRAIASSSPELTTRIAGASVTAGSLVMSTLHEPGASLTANARATGSGGGIVAGNIVESQATANARTDTSVLAGSTLRVGGALSMTASAFNAAQAASDARTGGVLGIGTTDPTANAAGSATVRLGGVVADSGSVTLRAVGTSTARADGAAATGGIIAGVGADSRATANPFVSALVTADTSVTSRGQVALVARSSADAVANALGKTGGLAALGSTTAVATVTPTVEARLDARARVTAGSLSLGAFHNADEAGNALSNRGAHANASAGTGGVIAGNSATATARTQATTTAAVETGARLTLTGTLGVTARSHDDADATSLAVAGGLAAVGAVGTDAQGRSATVARVSTPAALQAGAISLNAFGSGDVRALQSATVGGLLAFQTGTTATAQYVPTVSATLAGATGVPIGVTGDVSIVARANGTVDAESRGISAGAVALVDSRALAVSSVTVTASIGSATTLNAGGLVLLRALHNTTADGSGGSGDRVQARSNSSVGGLGGVDTGTVATGTSVASVSATVGNGVVLSARQLNVETHSRTFELVGAVGNAGGVLAAGKPRAFANATQAVTAQLGAGVRATLTDGMVISARTDNSGGVSTAGGKGGLLAFGGAESTFSVTNTVRALLGAGASISSPNGTVVMRTLNSADLTSGVASRADGGITTSEARARTLYTSVNETTVGANARIDARRADLSSNDTAVTLAANSSSATIAVDSNSFAESQVNAFMRTTTTVTTGAVVRGDDQVRLAAVTSNLRTFTDARAFIDLGLLGDSTAISDNNVDQENCVKAQSGSTIFTYDLRVEAPSAHLADGYTRIARADANTVMQVVTKVVEVGCRVGLAILTLGISELTGAGDEVCTEVRQVLEAVTGGATPVYRGENRRESCVEFDATVRTPTPRLVSIDISSLGVIKALGATVLERDDRYIVDAIQTTYMPQVLIDAGGGEITGNALFDLADELGAITVANATTKAIELRSVRPGLDKPSTFTVNGVVDGFKYQVFNRIGTVDLDVQSTGDIVVAGLVDAGGGTMKLVTAGSLRGAGIDSRIVASDLQVRATGSVGADAGTLAMTLVSVPDGGLGFATSSAVAAKFDLQAGGDVQVQLNGEQRGRGTFSLEAARLVAGGQALLDLDDARGFDLDDKTGTVLNTLTGSGIAFTTLRATAGLSVDAPSQAPIALALPGGGLDAEGVLNVDTKGDFSFSSSGDLKIGKVLATGNVSLSAAGSIIDLDTDAAEVDVKGQSISITAGGRVLGELGKAPLLVDTAAGGRLALTAGGDAAVREVSGNLLLAGVAVGGDATLVVRGGSVVGAATTGADVAARTLTLDVRNDVGSGGDALQTNVRSVAGTVGGSLVMVNTGDVRLGGHGNLGVVDDLVVEGRAQVGLGSLDVDSRSTIAAGNLLRVTVGDTRGSLDTITVRDFATVKARSVEFSAGDEVRVNSRARVEASLGLLVTADSATVDPDAGGALVQLTGTLVTPQVKVVTGRHDDDVRLGALGAATLADLSTGDGDDLVTLGWAANGLGRLSRIDGGVSIDTGLGKDSLVLDRRGDAPNVPGQVGASTVTGFGLEKPVTFKNAEAVQVLQPVVIGLAPAIAVPTAPAPAGAWAAAPAVMGPLHFDARAGEWRTADASPDGTAEDATDALVAAALADAATRADDGADAVGVDWEAAWSSTRPSAYVPLAGAGPRARR